VGQFLPNAFGLYDLHGNVWEWCFDGYEARYYDQSPAVDPFGPSQVRNRVLRGGMWWGVVHDSRSAKRANKAPSYRDAFLGFRVARGIPLEATASRGPEKAPELDGTPAAAGASNVPPKKKATAITKKPSKGSRTNRAARLPKEITNSIGMPLWGIPAGEFLMGAPDSDIDAQANAKPRHLVRITRPFYLGVNEVTVGQFRRVVEASGYRTQAEKDGKGSLGWNEQKGQFEVNPKYTWRNPGFAQTEAHPVVNVSWNDAIAFCNKLSELEELKPFYQVGSGTPGNGDGYRLPTEAEWEYACRAETMTRFYSGDDQLTLLRVANTADGALLARAPSLSFTFREHDGFAHTAPVGQFLPNAFGLNDMHGNVWEFCADGYEDRYYDRSPVDDPRGPAQFTSRVMRGGSWWGVPHDSRSATRGFAAPDERTAFYGFRVARSISPAQ
jgi:formylglycine-generating enzyme required for sulfatase activity